VKAKWPEHRRGARRWLKCEFPNCIFSTDTRSALKRHVARMHRFKAPRPPLEERPLIPSYADHVFKQPPQGTRTIRRRP
jgi:hypothetical protein